MLSAIVWGGLAAASLMIGYLLARRGLSNRTIGMIMGIGAGALLSAIAYELIPESKLDGAGMAVTFCLGAIAFFGADWIIDHRGGADRKDIAGDQAGGSGAAIFVGTLLDNVPESIILGMSVALGGAIILPSWQRRCYPSNNKKSRAGCTRKLKNELQDYRTTRLFD